MPELEEINKIEIRSEEYQEILGATPRWIIRAGISVAFGVVIIMLIGSWFFKYPQILQSKITLTTQNPPASLIAHRGGKITDIFVIEKQEVKQNEAIAIIENTANYKDVFLLETILDTIKELFKFNDSMTLILGDFQQTYSSFLRLLKDYTSFRQLGYFAEKIESVKQQKRDYQLYYDRLWTQRNLKEKELHIAKKQFERDKSLFDKGVYSKSDYEKAQKLLLQEELSFENTRTVLANTQMQINQLDQQILDLKMQEAKEQGTQEVAITEAFQNLKSKINSWKQNYLIVTPIEGKVAFTKIWSKNQNVVAGEIVATIIPKKYSNIIGKVEIPVEGAGKVKLGQSVNIKFDNYPYIEFGLLRGTIKTISLIPSVTERGAIYMAEIEISDTMISNYGIQLKFSQEMTGTADIITDDIRLLERFVNPLKSIWKKNVEM
ncbi:MAG: HlyD family efflux transporter periplasmic adaptor subunit [Bacteroidetes bacterium]|nr:HlyD family efflux transporter periplasmic adaptor subunit [Bacteroidota bacterium]